MAELKIDLGPMMRAGMIESLADLIDALPQYRMAVILELLMRDEITRCMIAEAIGEEGIKQHHLDIKNDDVDGYVEQSWDDIALAMLKELKDTPGGRAEVI